MARLLRIHDPSEAWKAWNDATIVCFDVDSTVQLDEGIDALAAHCGCKEEVAALTRSAMGGPAGPVAGPSGGGPPGGGGGGDGGFTGSLRARLGIIQPTLAAVEHCAAQPLRLSPGIEELVFTLHRKGAKVCLISGGFERMIFPIAEALEIPRANVFANRLLFDEEGKFTGFDESLPTARTGGKAEVVRRLKEEERQRRRQKNRAAAAAAAAAAAGGGATGGGGGGGGGGGAGAASGAGATAEKAVLAAHVGDGATDLETRVEGGADVFIGYGGVAARKVVREGADLFVSSFEDVLVRTVGRDRPSFETHARLRAFDRSVRGFLASASAADAEACELLLAAGAKLAAAASARVSEEEEGGEEEGLVGGEGGGRGEGEGKGADAVIDESGEEAEEQADDNGDKATGRGGARDKGDEGDPHKKEGEQGQGGNADRGGGGGSAAGSRARDSAHDDLSRAVGKLLATNHGLRLETTRAAEVFARLQDPS